MNLKKIVIAVSGIILILIIAGFFLIILPFMGTKNVHPGTSFAGGRITNVVDGMSQVFIIDGGGKEIALIDAGNSPDGKPIIDALALKGLAPSDVKAIFLTHGHPDHIAAVKIFSSAKIYSLKDEVEIAEGIKNNRSPLGMLFSPMPTGIKITDILNDGDIVKVGSLDLKVFSIPGHTEGSAAYLISGVLFLGDAALSSSDGKINHAVWIFSTDVDRQNSSLAKLTERLTPGRDEVKSITFSHSGEIQGIDPLINYTSGLNKNYKF